MRPEVLWPATVQLLRSLLPGDALDDDVMIPLRGVSIIRQGRTLLSITPETLQRAGLEPMSTDPDQTRERLLRSGGFDLERGVEATAVLKDRDRVIGVRCREIASGNEREVLAAWTVGDDGADSRVRQGCAIELKLRPLPVDLLCFRCTWPEGLSPGKARFWLNAGRLASGVLGLGVIPLPGGQGAGLIPTRPRVFADVRRAADGWRRLSASDPLIAAVMGPRRFPDDLTRVRRSWGHAQRYGCAGAVLLGDAAHPVSPAGGQGANMAVADAVALAEVISDGGSAFLDEYERRRRPANERSVLITRRAARVLSLPSLALELVLPLALKWLDRRPERIARGLRFVATAFLEHSRC